MPRVWIGPALAVAIVATIGPGPASAAPTHGSRAGACEDGRAERSLPAGAAHDACEEIRPGGPVWTELVFLDQPCTLNFLFTGYRIDEEGRRVEAGSFIGTAGHCVIQGQGNQVWEAGEGPRAYDSGQKEIGRFVYAAKDGAHGDFSLLRLHDGVEASPRMCEFGGPTGINTELSSEPEMLRMSGQGIGIREVAPGRQIVARHMSDPDVVFAAGPGITGDSGTPVIDDLGRAVGVMYAVGARTNPPDANLVIGRLGPQLTLAEQRLGLELELQTAALTA